MSENNFERIVIEDYKSDFLYKKNKSNLNITFNRIAFIFFVFLIVCSIYSIRVVYLGGLNVPKEENITHTIKSNYRADIIDNNGSFIVKSVRTTDVGINPKLVTDKKKLQCIIPKFPLKKNDVLKCGPSLFAPLCNT